MYLEYHMPFKTSISRLAKKRELVETSARNSFEMQSTLENQYTFYQPVTIMYSADK